MTYFTIYQSVRERIDAVTLWTVLKSKQVILLIISACLHEVHKVALQSTYKTFLLSGYVQDVPFLLGSIAAFPFISITADCLSKRKFIKFTWLGIVNAISIIFNIVMMFVHVNGSDSFTSDLVKVIAGFVASSNLFVYTRLVPLLICNEYRKLHNLVFIDTLIGTIELSRKLVKAYFGMLIVTGVRNLINEQPDIYGNMVPNEAGERYVRIILIILEFLATVPIAMEIWKEVTRKGTRSESE